MCFRHRPNAVHAPSAETDRVEDVRTFSDSHRAFDWQIAVGRELVLSFGDRHYAERDGIANACENIFCFGYGERAPYAGEVRIANSVKGIVRLSDRHCPGRRSNRVRSVEREEYKAPISYRRAESSGDRSLRARTGNPADVVVSIVHPTTIILVDKWLQRIGAAGFPVVDRRTVEAEHQRRLRRSANGHTRRGPGPGRAHAVVNRCAEGDSDGARDSARRVSPPNLLRVVSERRDAFWYDVKRCFLSPR